MFFFCLRYKIFYLLFRLEFVEGFLFLSRCGSRNGEKDWENALIIFLVVSGIEYIG